MDRIKKTIRITVMSLLCIAVMFIQTMVVSAASADNSLSALTLSEGTLSPAFAYNVVNYTASVSSDTTSITVDAKASNKNAVIQSGAGSYDLKEGENTIQVVVAAENGNVATYTVKVTRGGASNNTNTDAANTDANNTDTNNTDAANTNTNNTDTNNTDTSNTDAENTDTPDDSTAATVVTGADGYTVADNIPEAEIPAGFTATTVTYGEKECSALKFEKGEVTLLYMVNAENKGSLFVYDASSSAVYPFVKLTAQDKYLILLQAPSDAALGDAYAQTELVIGDKSVPAAYQNSALNTPDFYQVYGIDSDGNSGWYQYDSVGETYQRYQQAAVSEQTDITASEEYQFLQNAYNELSEKYSELKSRDTRFIAVLIVVIAILLIVIVNLIIFRKDRGSRRDEEFYDDEEQFADFEEDEELDIDSKPETSAKKKEKKKYAGKKKDIFDDEDGIDFFEEDTLTRSAGAKETSSVEDDLEVMDLNDL